MWSPHGLGMGGRMDQVDEEIPGHVGWEGKVWFEVWRGGKVLVALERAPLQKGSPFARRARPCCLLDRQGLKPLQEVW